MHTLRVDYEWSMRLLLSVDVAGSTAFKAEHASRGMATWVATFEDLFTDFPGTLEKAYVGARDRGFPSVDLPDVWKFIGDEIVFVASLTRHDDTLTHIAAFRQAVNEYSDEWRGKFPTLGLKATAWTAGFPVTNAAINFRLNASHHPERAATECARPGPPFAP